VLGGAGLQPCVYAAVQHAALAAEVHSVLQGKRTSGAEARRFSAFLAQA